MLFLRKYVDSNIKAVSVSSLEDKSIQRVHKLLGIEAIRPYKSKVAVLNELGFPVISKEKAKKISILQTPDSEKQTFIHAIMTGDMGEQGHYQHSDKIKLPDKWLELFAGYYGAHRPDLHCKVAPFKVSADCCYWMKEKPADDWAKAHNSYPYLGLMASEGGQREQGLMKNGCNYFGKSTTRSCPFAIFMRQDLLQLALDLDVPVPEVYGIIERDRFGTLRTTRAQRTGCSMCGFGLHIEKRPHRFDRLKQGEENGRNAFVRKGELDSDGFAVFKITNVIQGDGAVATRSFASLNSEPLFLTARGVYALTPSDVTGECTTIRRKCNRRRAFSAACGGRHGPKRRPAERRSRYARRYTSAHEGKAGHDSGAGGRFAVECKRGKTRHCRRQRKIKAHPKQAGKRICGPRRRCIERAEGRAARIPETAGGRYGRGD